MATQEEIWTREFLRSKGVSDDQIGWRINPDKKSGVVTVGGKDFITASYPGGGKSYATREALEAAWDNLNKSNQQNATNFNYANEIQSLAQELRNRLSQHQPAQFNYNPQSDPEYSAALARARQNIEQGQNQVMAEMNRRGLLNSTITSDRGQRISSQEMGRLETEIIPQLVNQAYQRYLNEQQQQQQQFANMLSLLESFSAQDHRDRLFNRNIYESDRAFEYQKQMDELAQRNLEEEKEYRRQRDSEEDRRWWAEYEQRGREFAEQMGYNWEQLSQRQKEFAADQAYRQQSLALERERFEASKNQPATTDMTKNELTAMYVQYLDAMTPENRNKFFKNEKSGIIKDLGTSGYNQLKEMYGIYD